jgi:hypothetical protein
MLGEMLLQVTIAGSVVHVGADILGRLALFRFACR